MEREFKLQSCSIGEISGQESHWHKEEAPCEWVQVPMIPLITFVTTDESYNVFDPHSPRCERKIKING